MSIYASAFRHGWRKKDNTHQIKIKIRVPDFDFQADFPIEYFNDGKKYKLSLSEAEWNNLTNKANKIIEKAKFRYDECVSHILKCNYELSTKSINSLYKQNIFDFTRDIQIEELKRLLAYTLPENLINDYEDQELIEIANNIEVGTDEELQADEMGDIILDAESKLRFKKLVKQTNEISNNLERCDAQYLINGYYDFTKIIDVFGYFWCLRKPNGARYLDHTDNKIILRIAEYIFITNASNQLVDFNKNWVISFFLYLRDYGYVDTRKVRNYTPLELYDFKKTILNKSWNRKIYRESSFENLIKKFKKYFRLLRDETELFQTVPYNNLSGINLESIKHDKTNFLEQYTQKDHYVDGNEMKLLFNYNSSNEDLNLTRDLFFIQVYSSGNRSIDKDTVTYVKKDGIEYIEVHHSKTNSKNISGIFQPLKQLLDKRHNGILPKISMNAKAYNTNLKAISKDAGLDRKIQFVFNRMNSLESEYEYKPLYESISQYFTRHTLVNYLVDAGRSDKDIIEIFQFSFSYFIS